MALGEGEVGTAGPEGIEYGAVTSCLTATVLLDNGNHVGGHFSLVQAPGAFASNEVLAGMLSLIPADATPIMIHLAGVLSMWSSAYLSEPLWVGVGEAADVNPAYAGNVPGPDDCGPTIAYALGAPDVACTSEEREGAFTIRLPE